MSRARDELHRLADELPEDLAGEVVDFAEWLRARRDVAQHPPEYARVLAILDAAPLDDEPLTERERADLKEAWAEHRRDGGINLKDLIAEMED